MVPTKQQDRKKQMVFNKHWTGRAPTFSWGLVCVCPLSKNISSFAVSVCNNNIVSVRVCCSTSVEEQRALEAVARIVCVQWKQLDWTDREKKKTVLSKKQLHRSGGREKLMVKQEVWLERSSFDWKIFFSRAFRCAVGGVCKRKTKSGGKPVSGPYFLEIVHPHGI